MKHTCQQPTKRSVFWKDRPTTVVIAATQEEAAAKLAKRRGPGVWWVNIATEQREGYAMPSLYSSYKVTVG